MVTATWRFFVPIEMLNCGCFVNQNKVGMFKHLLTVHSENINPAYVIWIFGHIMTDSEIFSVISSDECKKYARYVPGKFFTEEISDLIEV